MIVINKSVRSRNRFVVTTTAAHQILVRLNTSCSRLLQQVAAIAGCINECIVKSLCSVKHKPLKLEQICRDLLVRMRRPRRSSLCNSSQSDLFVGAIPGNCIRKYSRKSTK